MKLEITWKHIGTVIGVITFISMIVWRYTVLDSRVDYLIERDREERIFLLNRMNIEYLKVQPSIKDTTL